MAGGGGGGGDFLAGIGSGREAFDHPVAAGFTAVAQPVVQAARPALPEFHRLGREPESAPVGRQWHLAALAFLFNHPVTLLQHSATSHDGALRRGPRRQLARARPASITTLLVLAQTQTIGLVVILVALATNLALVVLALRYSNWLGRKIGPTGLRAISKIISMLLAAIAVSMIRRGWSG